MHAILLHTAGSADHFRLVDVPLPEPAPDEVRIRVRAAGFNPADYQMRQTLAPEQLPIILGGEVAGVVDAVGAEVETVQVGDEVIAYLARKRGGYAEYVCVHSFFVAPKPQGLTLAQSAALPLAGLTAYQSVLTHGQQRAAAPIFIAGGSGGVGTFAIQIARAHGAFPIITTAGSAASAAYLTDVLRVPPEHIVRYDQVGHAQVATRAREVIGGNRFPLALDCVGGPMTRVCCDLIDFDGRVVSIVAGTDSATSDALFDISASFHCVYLPARAKFGTPAQWSVYHAQLHALVQLVEQGHIQAPLVAEVGTLQVETVRAAHHLLEAGHVQGKLVMIVS